MSTSAGNSPMPTEWRLSLHLRQALHSERKSTRRAISKDVIVEVIRSGTRHKDHNDPSVYNYKHTIAGITFRVAVNPYNKKILSAYPTSANKMEAIRSNQWTRPIIKGIEQRIEEGKTRRRRER